MHSTLSLIKLKPSLFKGGILAASTSVNLTYKLLVSGGLFKALTLKTVNSGDFIFSAKYLSSNPDVGAQTIAN